MKSQNPPLPGPPSAFSPRNRAEKFWAPLEPQKRAKSPVPAQRGRRAEKLLQNPQDALVGAIRAARRGGCCALSQGPTRSPLFFLVFVCRTDAGERRRGDGAFGRVVSDALGNLRDGAAACFDTLMARFSGFVAALFVVGPEVEVMMATLVSDASDECDEASRLLRRGANAAALPPVVNEMEQLLGAVENNATKLQR